MLFERSYVNNFASPAASTSSSGICSKAARERARKASLEIRKRRNETSGGSCRSALREHTAIKFILSVIHGEKDGSVDFADWLKDGKILMDVMLTLSFNSVPADPFPMAGERPEETRIRNLIETIENYGVEKKFIFKVGDLWEQKNTPKVVKCIEEIQKLATQEEHVHRDVLKKNKLYA